MISGDFKGAHIRCDTEGCEARFSVEQKDKDMYSSLIERAASVGWTKFGEYTHYCPFCSAKRMKIGEIKEDQNGTTHTKP